MPLLALEEGGSRRMVLAEVVVRSLRVTLTSSGLWLEIGRILASLDRGVAVKYH